MLSQSIDAKGAEDEPGYMSVVGYEQCWRAVVPDFQGSKASSERDCEVVRLVFGLVILEVAGSGGKTANESALFLDKEATDMMGLVGGVIF